MTRTMSPQHALAVSLMHEAGERALDHFRRRDTLALSTKGPLDFVSEADKDIERFARDAVSKTFDGASLAGEELGGEMSDDYWIIDPIDGTANFLRGNPLWGISLAHMANGVPDIGVIRYPVLGITVSATAGSGLFVDGKAARRDDTFGDVRLAAVGENNRWRAEDIGDVEKHLRHLGWGVAQYRCASISLGFAALGRTDGYLERHLSLWDLAAGVLICREAGLQSFWGGAPVAQGMWVMVGTQALIEDTTEISTRITG